MAINQYRGVSLTEIFPFIETSVSQKIIEVGNFYRATGSFYDPNYYSLYMAILAASLLFYTDKFSAKFFFLIALVGITLSLSRMGIILMVILIIIYLSQRIRLKNVIVICTILSIIITGMYVFNFFDNYQQYPLVYNILYRFETGGTFQLDVIGYYFKDILNISNLLFGLGLENFEYALDEKIGIWQQAHNQYIQMIADIGIIGLSPLLILIFIFIKKYKLKLLSKKNPFLFPFIIILFGNMSLLNTYETYIYLFCGLYIGFIIEKLNREVKS
jgi:O-antigen ligase